MKLQALSAVLAALSVADAAPQPSRREGASSKAPLVATSTTMDITEGHPTLVPFIPDHLDIASTEALARAKKGQIFYGSGVEQGMLRAGTAARLSLDFQFPTLILDHALETYDSVSCDGHSMSMTFKAHDYYKFVKKEWDEDHEMVVITSERGCSSYSTAHHTYFKASELKFDESTYGLTLKGEHLTLEDIMEDALLEFGMFSDPDAKIGARAGGKGKTTAPMKARPAPTSSSSSKKSSTKSSTSTAKNGAASKAAVAGSSTAPTTTGSTTKSSSTTTSSTSTSGTQCGKIPSATISGLPAASCGAGFDDALDNALGLLKFDGNNFAGTWDSIAPGAGHDAFYDDAADLAGPPAKRALDKRWGVSIHINIGQAVKQMAAKVTQTVQKAVTTVAKTINSIPNAIVSAAKAVYSFAKAVVEGHPSISLRIPMRYFMGGLDRSPWGQAKLLHVWKKKPNEPTTKNDAKAKAQLIKQGPELLPDDLEGIPHIALFCYRCGFNGTFTATGAVGFNLHGIHTATLDMVGDLDLSLNLGFEALAIKTFPIAKRRLFNTGVPGFSIPNIIALGPVLYVEAGVNVEIKAIGQILAGTTISFRNAKTHVDFMSPSKGYSSNWKPTFTDIVKVHGELSAGLVFELPIGLLFGLDVLNGKYKKSIGALVDTTSIELAAKVEFDYAGQISANTSNGATNSTGQATFNNGSCYGVEWTLDLINQLNFDIMGTKNYKIFELKLPIANGCIGKELDEKKGDPSKNPIKGIPGGGMAACATDNLIQNGNFDNRQLSPWNIHQINSQNSIDTSQGDLISRIVGVQASPYSAVNFRQSLTLCAGSEYTFSFDFMYDDGPYDVYTYATIIYPDDASGASNQNVFGYRSYNTPAVGHWQHHSKTFTPTADNVEFEILTVAANHESTTVHYDNLNIQLNQNSNKRSVPLIEARQDLFDGTGPGDGDPNLQLDVPDGFDENAADTQNPDNVDPFNPDGTKAAPPDDSDLDKFIHDSAEKFSDEQDNTQSFTDIVGTIEIPGNNTGGSNDTANTFPALPDDKDISFINLVSSDGAFQLSAGPDGNVYLESVNPQSTSGMFANSDGVLSADFNNRLFHMYDPEMKALNASRLRLSDLDTGIPKTSLLVGLVGVQTGSSFITVAADTLGNIYYLAACNLKDANTKVFLVNDPVAGLKSLKTEVASYTITGGVATDCYMLGIKPPSVKATA